MSNQWPGSGWNDVGAYALPGIPWVSGSTLPEATIVQLTFPAATTFFTVRNTAAAGNTMTVGFSLNGMGLTTLRHNFTLTGGQEQKLELRTTQLFLSATQGAPTWEVVAGLSTVMYSKFPIMTGSYSGSTGNATLPIFSGIG